MKYIAIVLALLASATQALSDPATEQQINDAYKICQSHRGAVGRTSITGPVGWAPGWESCAAIEAAWQRTKAAQDAAAAKELQDQNTINKLKESLPQ